MRIVDILFVDEMSEEGVLARMPEALEALKWEDLEMWAHGKSRRERPKRRARHTTCADDIPSGPDSLGAAMDGHHRRPEVARCCAGIRSARLRNASMLPSFGNSAGPSPSPVLGFLEYLICLDGHGNWTAGFLLIRARSPPHLHSDRQRAAAWLEAEARAGDQNRKQHAARATRAPNWNPTDT
jgi:hypothetical protein